MYSHMHGHIVGHVCVCVWCVCVCVCVCVLSLSLCCHSALQEELGASQTLQDLDALARRIPQRNSFLPNQELVPPPRPPSPLTPRPPNPFPRCCAPALLPPTCTSILPLYVSYMYQALALPPSFPVVPPAPPAYL
jgi:hypothetical protein